MLLSITEQCRMNCPHCMDNATPEGNHMSFETFKVAVSFFNKYGGIELIISGGEPTENPDYLKMLEYAIDHANGPMGIAHITLATNGMNISGNQEIQDKLLRLLNKVPGKLAIQITSVDGLYPIKVDFSDDFFKYENVVICTEIEAMYPQGRAIENNIKYYNTKASKCFNVRSLVRQFGSLSKATMLLAYTGKFCTPRVNWNGDIKLGESRLCPTVATIYDSNYDIVKSICEFKCKGCSILNDKLPDNYLKAIGEK